MSVPNLTLLQESSFERSRGDSFLSPFFFQIADLLPGVEPLLVHNHDYSPILDGLLSFISQPFPASVFPVQPAVPVVNSMTLLHIPSLQHAKYSTYSYKPQISSV